MQAKLRQFFAFAALLGPGRGILGWVVLACVIRLKLVLGMGCEGTGWWSREKSGEGDQGLTGGVDGNGREWRPLSLGVGNGAAETRGGLENPRSTSERPTIPRSNASSSTLWSSSPTPSGSYSDASTRLLS